MKSRKISKRIMMARFYLKCKKLTVIQAYAQTKHAMDEVKDKLCNQLQDTLSTCNTHDMNVVMGDLNAKVGKDNTNRDKVMGSHGVGVMNDNSERLCDFCKTNGLVITRTMFPHKKIHKATWGSPYGKTANQIDHMLINGRIRTSILDTRALRAADIYSVHYIVRITIRLMLATNEEMMKGRECFDVRKL